MRESVVRLANDLLPPALIRLTRRFRPSRYGFFGSYATFAEAAAAAGGPGYADSAMVEALVRTQRQRLSTPVELAQEHRWLRLQLALSHARQSGPDGELRVLDFGGAAGTHYFDLVRWRERSGWPDAQLSWHVCETPPMAVAAQAELGGEELTFLDSLGSIEGNAYDLVYVSGSLQYVPDAETTWAGLSALPHSWIALDRTPFFGAAADRFAVQRAPVPGGSPATYPGRFLAVRPWLDRMARTHDLVARWQLPAVEQPYIRAIRGVTYGGMLLRRR